LGCTDKTVEAAFNRGEILRTHVLRPTWHLVAPENIRFMTALSSDKIKASTKPMNRRLEITEELYVRANRVIVRALEGGNQRTRDELSNELERAGIATHSAYRMIHFMLRAEVDGIVCSGALQGKKHTYVLLDERVPAEKAIPREEALAKLAWIYYNSRGPATLSDFMWWSGLSKSEASIGLDAIKSNLEAEKIGEEIYYIQASRDGDYAEQSAHLLPAFDEFIIGYQNRNAVLSAEHFNRVVSRNGIFRPALIVNGKAVGLWKSGTDKDNTVVFEFFEPPDTEILELTEKAKSAHKAFVEGVGF
jgi:hypothetical protein